MTRSLSKPYNVRLNASDEHLLRCIEEVMRQSDIDYLTKWDHSQREGYRGRSGRKPQARALLLRRALSLGLPLVGEELLMPIEAFRASHELDSGTDDPTPEEQG